MKKTLKFLTLASVAFASAPEARALSEGVFDSLFSPSGKIARGLESAPAARRKSSMCFPGVETLRSTRQFCRWTAPCFLCQPAVEGASATAMSVFREGERPTLRFVAGNFGPNDARFSAAAYDIIDARGRVVAAGELPIGGERVLPSGGCLGVSAALDAAGELKSGSYRVVVTLNPGAEPTVDRYPNRMTLKLTIVGPEGLVARAGQQVFTLFDRVRTGFPVASAVVPDGYSVSGKVIWTGDAAAPVRSYIFAYDTESLAQLTLSSPRRLENARVEAPLAAAASQLDCRRLQGELAREMLTLYGFVEFTGARAEGDAPVEPDGDYVAVRKALHRRVGRNLTGVRAGCAFLRYYGRREGGDYAVGCAVPYLLEEFDGKTTELVIQSVDSYCTGVDEKAERTLRAKLGDFARSRERCPLFTDTMRPLAYPPASVGLYDAAAVARSFETTMGVNGFDDKRFLVWLEVVKAQRAVRTRSGVQALVDSAFGYCAVNPSSGDVLYWNPGFVDRGYTPVADPRMGFSAWEFCPRPEGE